MTVSVWYPEEETEGLDSTHILEVDMESLTALHKYFGH